MNYLDFHMEGYRYGNELWLSALNGVTRVKVRLLTGSRNVRTLLCAVKVVITQVHTVVVDDKAFALRLLPSGILYDNKQNIVGTW